MTLKFAVADIGFDEETGCLEEVTEDYVKLRSEYGDEIYLVGIAFYKIVVHRDCGRPAGGSRQGQRRAECC